MYTPKTLFLIVKRPSLLEENEHNSLLLWCIFPLFVLMCKGESTTFFGLSLIQWGSEIQISLDFEWSKKGLVANGPDFEWDLKSMSPTDHWNTKPFEI